MIAVETEFPLLPAGLRASRPAERRGIRRDHVRLLVIDRETTADNLQPRAHRGERDLFRRERVGLRSTGGDQPF